MKQSRVATGRRLDSWILIMLPWQCNFVWEFDAAVIRDEHEEVAEMAKSSGSQNGRVD